MGIVDSTQRQLIRNRIHEVTDLALEINEGEAYRATVMIQPLSHPTAIVIDWYQVFEGYGAPQYLKTTIVNLPVVDDQPRFANQYMETVERLEEIVDEMVGLIPGGAQ